MKLFDFFTKLIKTVAKLFFHEKYQRLLNRSEAKSTQPRTGDVHQVRTHPVRIPPAAPPANNANGVHKKPELEPVKLVVTEDSVFEGREPLPAVPDVYKPADVQEPPSLPLELEVEVVEGVEDHGYVPTDIEFSDPQVIEAPIIDVERPAPDLDEPENINTTNFNETEQQSTEVKLRETINEEGTDLQHSGAQVIDVEEPSSQLIEQKTGMIVEKGDPNSNDTELVVSEVADEIPPVDSSELEIVKIASEEGSETIDELPIIEIDKVEKPDVEDNFEDEEGIEDEIGGYEDDAYGEVEVEGSGVLSPKSSVPREARKDREKTRKKSTQSPFDRWVMLVYELTEEKPDVDAFIRKLEADDLDDIFNLEINQLEKHFFEALKRYEYIGEMPFSENAYKKLIEYLRLNARKNGKINPRCTLPTLFSVSMVFCARYSDTEAREFWKPFAQQVWDCEPSQYFQNICRQLFAYSREYLHRSLNLSFTIQNQGDVVRPVYQHAIIPSYLQNYFAEWLVNNFESILQYPAEKLPMILQYEKSLDYVPRRLRNFIRGEETKDTAARLIARMSNAIRLFHEVEQTEAVESVMSSSIEKSLWEVIYKKLIDDQSHIVKLRRITPRLEWLWDIEGDDIILNLSNIRSSQSDKPDSVTWAEKDAKHLKGNEVLFKIYPWKLKSGDWEVDPIRIQAEGPLDGSILVLSENFDLDEPKQSQFRQVIFERTVPLLQKPILFFRVNPQRNVGVHKEQIDSDGSWMIVSSEDIYITDSAGNVVQASSLNIPYRLRESGFIQAGIYPVQLPVTVHLGEKSLVFEGTEDQQQINPFLRGIEKVPGLSADIPPIFLSPNINFLFSINPDFHHLRRTWLLIHRNGKFLQSILLTDLMSQGKMRIDENLCEVDLTPFLEQSGVYSISLLHNMRSLLEEPVQFAWLPEDVEIIGPSPDDCYSPLNPLQVTIGGVSEGQVVPTPDEKSKIITEGNTVRIEWKLIRNPHCRFDLLWQGSLIHFKWNIDRVSAWIEGGGDKSQVFEDQAKTVMLQVRGRPKEEFSWIVGELGKQRYTRLNAKGDYQANLLETEVRDMLFEDNQAKSSVSIAIRDYNWKLFDYYKKPNIEITKVNYEKPVLEISLTQVRKLRGSYTIQFRQITDQSKPEILSVVEVLEDNLTFQVVMNPGKYRIDVLLYDTLIHSSPTFQVDDEPEPIEETNTKLQVFDDYGSPEHLFRVLTATSRELLNRSYDRLPITPAIEQLQLIHTPDEWLTNARWNDGLKRLLPSWAVLMYPLRFTTKNHRRILHVFPEKVAYGGRAGRGYIELKLEEEKIRIAASWRPGKDLEYSQLWMGISQEQSIKFFSELDQDDLWPAYQCKGCGTIVASKDGTYLKLPPSVVQLHRHDVDRKLNEQFIDTVYDNQNIVEVSFTQYKDRPLQHAYWAKEVVFNNYLQFLIEGKIRSIHGGLEQPINLFKNIDYGLAVSDLFEHLQLPATQKLLEYSNEIDQLDQFIEDECPNQPAFNAMQRLMKYVYAATSPFNIPGNVLSLAMVLRLKANQPQVYSNLLANLGISESILVDILRNTAQGCPKMLEWSIAWAELFYVHAIS